MIADDAFKGDNGTHGGRGGLFLGSGKVGFKGLIAQKRANGAAGLFGHIGGISAHVLLLTYRRSEQLIYPKPHSRLLPRRWNQAAS